MSDTDKVGKALRGILTPRQVTKVWKAYFEEHGMDQVVSDLTIKGVSFTTSIERTLVKIITTITEGAIPNEDAFTAALETFSESVDLAVSSLEKSLQSLYPSPVSEKEEEEIARGIVTRAMESAKTKAELKDLKVMQDDFFLKRYAAIIAYDRSR